MALREFGRRRQLCLDVFLQECNRAALRTWSLFIMVDKLGECVPRAPIFNAVPTWLPEETSQTELPEFVVWWPLTSLFLPYRMTKWEGPEGLSGSFRNIWLILDLDRNVHQAYCWKRASPQSSVHFKRPLLSFIITSAGHVVRLATVISFFAGLR